MSTLKDIADEVKYVVGFVALGIDKYQHPKAEQEKTPEETWSDPVMDKYRQELREAKLNHYGLDDNLNTMEPAVVEEIIVDMKGGIEAILRAAYKNNPEAAADEIMAKTHGLLDCPSRVR